MNKHITTAVLSGLAIFATASPAHAAVTALVNGNFEADPPAPNNGDIQVITSWFEGFTPATGSGYQDWLFRSTTEIPTNSTNVLGFSTTTGYVYQQIGTYTSGEQVTFTGDAYKRATATSQFTGMTVQLYSGNFTGADGSDITSLTLLDTQTRSAAQLGLPTSGIPGGSAAFSITLDSGIAGIEGTALWLRISKPNAGGEIFLDNLAVVPEPSTALLGGLGVLALLRRRR